MRDWQCKVFCMQYGKTNSRGYFLKILNQHLKNRNSIFQDPIIFALHHALMLINKFLKVSRYERRRAFILVTDFFNNIPANELF